ncbi:MAG: hypothetical protein ABR577_02040 [Pyrinomonadaceae bacterium]
MKQRYSAAILTIIVLAFSSTAAFAITGDSIKEDTDARIINAKVVEVTDAHLSVIARTGVEHVIAIDRADTKVTIDGHAVSLKDVREGDMITIELDTRNPVKFAMNISVQPGADQLARIVP